MRHSLLARNLAPGARQCWPRWTDRLGERRPPAGSAGGCEPHWRCGLPETAAAAGVSRRRQRPPPGQLLDTGGSSRAKNQAQPASPGSQFVSPELVSLSVSRAASFEWFPWVLRECAEATADRPLESHARRRLRLSRAVLPSGRVPATTACLRGRVPVAAGWISRTTRSLVYVF